MNEALDALFSRRSVRNFETRQISDEDLHTILEAAMRAANAMNRQSWYFTVVQNRDLLDAISGAVGEVLEGSQIPSLMERARSSAFSSFHHAPTVVFVSGDGSRYSLADCANAAQNMCVAATALGLGSCYIGSFSQAFKGPAGPLLRERFSLPTGYDPVLAVALGYVKGDPPAPKNREWKVSYIR